MSTKMFMRFRTMVLGIAVAAHPLWASEKINEALSGPDIQLPSISQKAKILAFGDSLTAGVGGSGFEYPQRLSLLIGREVINAGEPGETSLQGRSRLGALLHETKPGLLILCLGTNDFLRHIAHEAVRANLQAMLDEASAQNIPVLLLAVPVPTTREIDPWFAEMSRPGQVRVDVHAMADVLNQPALKAGLVHPNSDGYRLVADAVARSLRSSGALRPK